jgi:hypothetical protein
MLLKNNTAFHVSIPGTHYSIRAYRTLEVPDKNYSLPNGVEKVEKKITVEKRIKKQYKGDE